MFIAKKNILKSNDYWNKKTKLLHIKSNEIWGFVKEFEKEMKEKIF